MLKLSLFEFFFRVLFDASIFVIGAHAFSRTKLHGKVAVKSTIGIAAVIFLIRRLPISYGIHTILGMIFIITIAILIHKIDAVNAIKAVIITSIIQFVAELINVAWIQLTLGKELDIIFANPYAKVMYGIPSVVIAGGTIVSYYIICSKRRELKDNGN